MERLLKLDPRIYCGDAILRGVSDWCTCLPKPVETALLTDLGMVTTGQEMI